MKKIHKFNIVMIIFLIGAFIVNNMGEECEVSVFNNLFLTLITFSYLFANLFGTSKK